MIGASKSMVKSDITLTELIGMLKFLTLAQGMCPYSFSSSEDWVWETSSETVIANYL